MSRSRVIRPLRRPVDTVVRPPGSKSQTIRALIAAALAEGRSVLHHPLEADDTAVARAAVSELGASVEEHEDRWVVHGTGGRLTEPAEAIDAGASGLTARSIIAVAPLADGPVTVTGRDRLPTRPMGGLVEALRRLGVDVDMAGPGLPITVEGAGRLPGGSVEVDASETTQFVTGLLLAAPLASEPLTVVPVGMEGSRRYLEMTIETMRAFGAEVSRVDGGFRVSPTGYSATEVEIEPDASAAVYPMVAAAITGGRVEIAGLGRTSLQPDLLVVQILEAMGCRVEMTAGATTVDARGVALGGVDVDLSEAPDGSLAVAAAALFARGPSRLRGLGSLRFKESDRLAALATELTRLGAEARIEGSELLITPGQLAPAAVETYGDHRIAMALALVGLVNPGVEILDPEVVGKTWPGYWAMLEALGEVPLRGAPPESSR